MTTVGYVKGIFPQSKSANAWVNDQAGSYTCPTASGVFAPRVTSWCLFENIVDAILECTSNSLCIGIACGIVYTNGTLVTNGALYCAPTKVPFTTSTAIISSTYLKGYKTLQQSNISLADQPDSYICPNATMRDVSNSSFCSFSEEIDAKNYCSNDQKCIGVLCNSGYCTLTAKKFKNQIDSMQPLSSPDNGAPIVITEAAKLQTISSLIEPAGKTTTQAYILRKISESEEMKHSTILTLAAIALALV